MYDLDGEINYLYKMCLDNYENHPESLNCLARIVGVFNLLKLSKKEFLEEYLKDYYIVHKSKLNEEERK